MQTRALVVLIGIVATLVLAGVVWLVISPPRPTPGAAFSTQQLLDSTSVPMQKVRDYVARLHFVAELGQSDLRHVNLEKPDRTIAKEILVWIQPEKGSHRLSPGDLQQGRIIAQIWSDSAYSRLGLQRGWNWWWVGEVAGTPQSVFVAESTGSRTPTELTVVQHDTRWYWKQAIARLVPGSVKTWGTCGGACCQS